jgi:tripartite-type tricarboxylate transporter receptor subunit TctC
MAKIKAFMRLSLERVLGKLTAAGYVPLLLAAGLALAGATPAQAWPDRPVRIIATSPPGGSVDLLARIAAEEFAKAFGQPFIVENRPGANGNIGAEVVLRAPPDGQLLFVAPPGPFSINAQLLPSTAFNPRSDIAPVALLGIAPLLLVVHPSVPASDLAQLIAWLKSRRGAVDYASQAVGSTGHLAMELFKTLGGVEAAHVPYKGSAAQATADLLAGRVAMGFVNTSTTLPYVRSGQLRAIAVAEKARIATAPDIPTLDEAGLPGFEATPWLGLGARAGTPPEIIQRLNDAARRALGRAEVLARLQGIGIEARAMTPEQFSAFIRAETEKWSDVIRRSGAKAE